MKRFIIFILSLGLCLMFTLSGCSCEGDAILEFSSAQIKSIKSETLSYSVTLEKDYKDIKRSSNFNESLLPEYRNGEYQTTYKTGVSSPYNEINLSPSESDISVLTTNLTIDVVDNKGTAGDDSDDVTYKDQIVSEVYFYDSAWSYAPIYSKTVVKNTYVANDETRIEFAHKIYQYETIYKKNSYVMKKSYYSPDENEDITVEMNLSNLDETNKLVPMTGNNKSYEYGFREVLDNVQLTFGARNLSIKKESSLTLPIVNYMYSSPMKLSLTNLSNSVYNIDKHELNYKTPSFEKTYAIGQLQIPVSNIKITLSNTNYMGLPKYVVVQNNSADDQNIKNNALIVEYAEGIVASASYNCLGALVYRLKDVNITYND